jgi:homeobox protein engrailed
MIEFKNLHDNFLMHQAFVAAAAAAAAAANLNASNNATIDTLQLNLANTSKSNEANYASPSSSSSSVYSNCSPKRVESVSSADDKPTPSELDKSDGSKQEEDNSYPSLPKKLKTRHHEDASSSNETSIEVDEKIEDYSECEQSNKPKSATDELKEELDVDVVAHKPANTSNNSAKRKLSEMEAEPNADDKEKAEHKLAKEKKSIMSSYSSSSLSSPSSSSTSSIHTSSNSMCSPQQQNASTNKQSPSMSSQKPSFLISDILGISSKPANSTNSTFSPSSTSSLSSTSSAASFPTLASFLNPASFLSNNERLIQQYQLSLQRAFPYLTGLNPAEFYKFIASTMSMDALSSSFSAESSNFQFPHGAANNNPYGFNKLNTPNPLSPPSMSSNRPAVVPNVTPNYKAHASTPILNNSPSKQPIPLQKLQQSPISNPVQAQLSKKPPVQSANFILSSLEQLTKNQFKDYPSPKGSSLSKKPEPSILSTVSSLKSEKITDSNDKKKVEDKQAKDSSKSGDAGKANNGNLFPAWVYCTRYSDRPSAGNYLFSM